MAFREEDFSKLQCYIDSDQVRVDEDLHEAWVTVPALSLDDMDRTGNLDICSIIRLTTTVRTMAYYCPGQPFLEYDRLTEEFFMFLACSKTTVSRELYQKIKEFNRPIELDARIHLSYVGKSSLNSVATLLDRVSGDELARNVNVMVCVDKGSRNSVPLPNWWMSKYGLKAVHELKQLKVSLMNPVDVLSNEQIQIPWSEMDPYRHTSYLGYVRMCKHSGMNVCKQDLYSKIKDDLLGYRTSSITVLHKQESTAGDLVNVETWESQQDPWTLNFSIKRDADILCQVKMTLHEK